MDVWVNIYKEIKVMNESIKLAENELKDVRTLQDKYQQNIFRLGRNSLQKLQAKASLKFAEEEEEKLGKEFLNLQKEENVLIETLLKKYGEGSIDLSAGTFIAEKTS
jgi:hypothetical protein